MSWREKLLGAGTRAPEVDAPVRRLLDDYVDAPHAAIDGPGQGEILNLTDHRAEGARTAQVDLVHDDPDRVVACLKKLRETPDLVMPGHHDVRISDVVMKRLRGNLAAAADRGAEDFADLLLVPGGIGTLPALQNEALLDWLRKRAGEAEITTSVCSGSAILAKAGLLDCDCRKIRRGL